MGNGEDELAMKNGGKEKEKGIKGDDVSELSDVDVVSKTRSSKNKQAKLTSTLGHDLGLSDRGSFPKDKAERKKKK